MAPVSPAAAAGLRPGDILKSIDGRHTRPLPAVVGQWLLRGAPGSTVTLGILRAGTDPFEVPVIRERTLPVPPESRRRTSIPRSRHHSRSASPSGWP